MFTGIVEDTGTITNVSVDDDGRRLRIQNNFDGMDTGQSISVAGVCLTVETTGSGWFEVFTATETLSKTYLDELAAGDHVNLERAVRADARLDGHIVQGHVDTTTTVREIQREGEDWVYTFDLPTDHEQYVVPRGAIAVDGISLTVAAIDDHQGTFRVAVIPETFERTTLSRLSAGDPVHVEVDILAKYVERIHQ